MKIMYGYTVLSGPPRPTWRSRRDQRLSDMTRKFLQGDGTTGRQFEDEMAGSPNKVNLPYRLSQEDMMAILRRHQPKNKPWNARRFRHAVANALDVFPHEIAMFTAVQTALDHRFGIDCWFEYNGFVVTVDLTLNPRKEKSKADIVVHLKHSESSLKEVASKTRDLFREKCRLEEEFKRNHGGLLETAVLTAIPFVGTRVQCSSVIIDEV